MANIPGILGFVVPGSYSLVTYRPGAVSLPGGPTIISILGVGQREEYLVAKAVGGGKDGAPDNFNPAKQPNGRYFVLSNFPVISGSLELYINPTGNGTDLPLVRIKGASGQNSGDNEQAEANAWAAEFADSSASVTFGAGSDPFDGYNSDSLDGYVGTDDGSGYFDSKWGRQYQLLKQRLGVGVSGAAEPNHYLFDPTTGRIVLDQPLKAFDTLLATYIAEGDINSPEQFFTLQDVVAKHGYPSTSNTISLAASIAFENGAGVVVPVHAGQVMQGQGSARKVVSEPTLYTALKALEKLDNIDIIVPVINSRIYNEIAMPFYEAAIYGATTGNGKFLQENPLLPGSPGIGVSPLALIPTGQAGAGNPVFLQVYKDGVLLQYGVDYSVPNVSGNSVNGTTNALIAFDPTYSGATHSINNTLQEGDKVVVSYLPAVSTLNLVATAQLAVVNHCEVMSQTKNRDERTCLLGGYEFVDLNFILDPIEGVNANFGGTGRAMFFWPGGPFVNTTIAGVSYQIDGQYVAAAAAGFCAANPITTSLTNKTLQGFTIDPSQKLSIDEASEVGGAAVAIVSPLAAGGKVVIGQTTSNSGNPVLEEYSVVRITDYVAKSVRKVLENAYTGGLITPNTTSNIKITTVAILASLQSQGIITAFQNVSTKVDPQEPRQVDVTFDITPIFPLNWIFITFSVGA